MDFLTIIIFLLLAGTILLYRSGHERHLGCVFLVRSKYGLSLIERLSKIRPEIWTGLCDMSVLVGFGGMGGLYLASFRETRRNLLKSMGAVGFIGLLAGLVLGVSGIIILTGLVALIIALYLLTRIENRVLDFITSTILISLAASLVINPTLSILIGVFGAPALLIYALALNGLGIVTGGSDLPGVSPLVPSSDESGAVGFSFPGYDLFIPFWYGLIALAVTLVSHEASHGVLSLIAKVKVKSTGLLTLGALPIGAFVEPDEKDLEEHKSVERMRVYTAGSLANFTVESGIIISDLPLRVLSAWGSECFEDSFSPCTTSNS